jgi:hypothetical protein
MSSEPKPKRIKLEESDLLRVSTRFFDCSFSHKMLELPAKIVILLFLIVLLGTIRVDLFARAHLDQSVRLFESIEIEHSEHLECAFNMPQIPRPGQFGSLPSFFDNCPFI